MADLVIRVTVELVVDHPIAEPLNAEKALEMANERLSLAGVIGRAVRVQSWRRS
jgi:hypothetical protein